MKSVFADGIPLPACPAELVVVRHAQSTGNAALAAAEAAGLSDADITQRDPDIPLSARGRQEAACVGHCLAQLPEQRSPEVVLSSPYVRARETVRVVFEVLQHTGRAVPAPAFDERLRDRESGVLSKLTTSAARARFPEEVRRQAHLGDLYYRPPGGESLADVALRLRSFLADLHREHAGRRVFVAAHDAVVIMFRFIIDGLSETDLMSLSGTVANASLTRWVADAGRLRLVEFARTDHLSALAGTGTGTGTVDGGA